MLGADYHLLAVTASKILERKHKHSLLFLLLWKDFSSALLQQTGILILQRSLRRVKIVCALICSNGLLIFQQYLRVLVLHEEPRALASLVLQREEETDARICAATAFHKPERTEDYAGCCCEGDSAERSISSAVVHS